MDCFKLYRDLTEVCYRGLELSVYALHLFCALWAVNIALRLPQCFLIDIHIYVYTLTIDILLSFVRVALHTVCTQFNCRLVIPSL